MARTNAVNLEAIARIIERVVARGGFELVHWEIVGPRNKFVLRIYIDKPGGVNHGDCELVSNQVGMLLDVEDLIPHSYTLEVSSPGIERGLYKQADFEKFAGNRVRLRTSHQVQGRRNLRGKLISIDGNVVKLDDDALGQIEIPYDAIVKANIEHQF